MHRLQPDAAVKCYSACHSVHKLLAQSVLQVYGLLRSIWPSALGMVQPAPKLSGTLRPLTCSQTAQRSAVHFRIHVPSGDAVMVVHACMGAAPFAAHHLSSCGQVRLFSSRCPAEVCASDCSLPPKACVAAANPGLVACGAVCDDCAAV